MALNLTDCDRMLAACRAHHVKLGIAYYRHFYPIVHRIKSLIESGEIGVPVVVQVNSFEWFDAGPDHPRAWLLEKEVSGGGPMFDFGCHRIEVLLDIFGRVSKICALRANRFFQREVEDVASVLFQFERGVAGMLTVAHSAGEPQDTFDLFGSLGSVHVPVLNQGEIRIVTAAGERTELHPPSENIHQPLLEDFINALLNDRQPQVSGEIGKAVAEVTEEIYAN
jgi:predicted dehydrogenase